MYFPRYGPDRHSLSKNKWLWGVSSVNIQGRIKVSLSLESICKQSSIAISVVQRYGLDIQRYGLEIQRYGPEIQKGQAERVSRCIQNTNVDILLHLNTILLNTKEIKPNVRENVHTGQNNNNNKVTTKSKNVSRKENFEEKKAT